jgi:hypothetical protein
VNRAVMASRAKMEGNVPQGCRPFKHLFHVRIPMPFDGKIFPPEVRVQ